MFRQHSNDGEKPCRRALLIMRRVRRRHMVGDEREIDRGGDASEDVERIYIADIYSVACSDLRGK